LATTGAVLECRRAFCRRGEGLALQAELKHLLGEDFADLDDEIFELRQLGTPGRPFGPPEAVGKVFGDALEVSARFFYLGTPLFVAYHPWLPVEVKAKLKTDRPRQSTRRPACPANHVLHPIQAWRASCDGLATSLDDRMRQELTRILGAVPW
jgi:hypothetical protein